MLVLASASPRRSELLTQAGYRFRVHPAHIPEDALPGEDPIAYVTRLAREKAEAVYRELTTASPKPEKIAVLGADTTVVLDQTILGKPVDAADAARMLRLLAGRTHRVITGVDDMRQPDVRTEPAEVLGVLGRGPPVGGPAEVLLVGGLGQVGVQPDTCLPGQFGAVAQEIGCDRER